MTDKPKIVQRFFTSGTRTVIQRPNGLYYIVCATCGEGGTFGYPTLDLATRVCVKASARQCRRKGCGAS